MKNALGSGLFNKSRFGALALGVILTAATAFAQSSAPRPGGGGGPGGGGWGGSSAPAPGSGGGFQPNVGPGPGGPGPGPGGPGPGGPAWGGPWGGGWYSSPSIVLNINPIATNSGVTDVVGVGYDAQGIWRTIPMRVSYNYVGAQYNVTVLNAWNPWTDMWNRGVDQPAYNTSYLLRGVTYNFYTVLSTGTYYFNL